MVIVCDGTDEAAARIARVLHNDPATGVMRHADAGYEIAIECAAEQGLNLPMVAATQGTLNEIFNFDPGSTQPVAAPRRLQPPVNITLDSGAFAAIDESVACVNAILAEGRTAYGISTGFGLLAQTRISTEDLENLQRSLVLSHAAGVGEPLDDDLARLIMVLKINSLSRGFSGIRLSVIRALIGW